MCQQVVVVASTNNKMKTSYSIKQVLKTLFKKQQKQHQKPQGSLESLESVDNLRNAQVEEAYYAEIDENAANEKLAQLAHSQEFEIAEEQEDEEDVYVPVRFARTTAGTFFWTTNLQPVASVEPAMCYSMQFQDRWAQA
ncbi:enhancer of split malpha protein [Drosophila ficusphila]|uniref:enhancer of split malpha protein n=1 Tax=Drosophila ficusphila TaxID=30025 RepID=UPI0007E689D9|nr:enhancer of split malpha protein [Drosophila ficusphila]